MKSVFGCERNTNLHQGSKIWKNLFNTTEALHRGKPVILNITLIYKI